MRWRESSCERATSTPLHTNRGLTASNNRLSSPAEIRSFGCERLAFVDEGSDGVRVDWVGRSRRRLLLRAMQEAAAFRQRVC